MRRREFIGLLGVTALSVARPGLGQTNTSAPLVGVLVPRTAEFAKNSIAALRQGLREAGLVEGTNYSLAMRFADGDLDRLPQLAKELGELKPKVIVGSAGASTAVHKILPEQPLVFTSYAADPIKAGFADSYARPGGITTGNVMNAIGGEEALTQKRISLFRGLVPNLARLGMIGSARGGLGALEAGALQNAAARLGFEFVHCPVETLDDLEGAFAAAREAQVTAIYISGDSRLFINMPRVLPFIAASQKPTLGVYPEWGRAGLLMSYSTDNDDGFRHAGIYVAKILAGTKPGDLPIEQASKFTLVINLKTAKALGITVPATLQSLADEVIE
jgi:putative ABC transport system substrate-binding protein